MDEDIRRVAALVADAIRARDLTVDTAKVEVWVRHKLCLTSCAEVGCKGCNWTHKVSEGIEVTVE